MRPHNIIGGLRLASLVVVLVGCTSSQEEAEQAVAPSVQFSASPTSISSGETTQLSWTVTDADSCTASDGWSGAKSTSGNEQTGPLASDTTFALSCAGPGGSDNASVTVTVSAVTPAPTISFTADEFSVTPGASTTLRWTTTDATSCTAADGWTGSRSVAGSESTGSLAQDVTYVLNCSGAGGSASATVIVTVSATPGAGLAGGVDSHLVNSRNDNRVYVFSGSVTPDDYDGDGGDPMLSIPVVQDEGSCTFAYQASGLDPGSYTIAMTNEADIDDPLQDDNLSFAATAQVTVAASGSAYDFRPANVVRVGPGGQYGTLMAAAQNVADDTLVEIDAGTYVDDISVWRQSDVTLRGVGGRPHFRADQLIPFTSGNDQENGQGILVLKGANISVENIEFSGARVPDENGAGIRIDGRDVTICQGFFHDNEDGILGSANGTLLIEYSEFDNNGIGEFGFTHNLYVVDGDRFIFRYNYSHHTFIGHQLKSRAQENFILYNRLMDEADGNASFALDFPNGGLAFVIGNLLQQGINTDNSAMVSYGIEGLGGGAPHRLYFVNNTAVDDLGGTFIQAAGGTDVVRLVNNIFVGGNTLVSGVTPSSEANLWTTNAGLVDVAVQDYRLTAGSAAVDTAVAPGQADGFELTPVYEYLHRTDRQARPQNGPLDAGALEYVP